MKLNRFNFLPLVACASALCAASASGTVTLTVNYLEYENNANSGGVLPAQADFSTFTGLLDYQIFNSAGDGSGAIIADYGGGLISTNAASLTTIDNHGDGDTFDFFDSGGASIGDSGKGFRFRLGDTVTGTVTLPAASSGVVSLYVSTWDDGGLMTISGDTVINGDITTLDADTPGTPEAVFGGTGVLDPGARVVGVVEVAYDNPDAMDGSLSFDYSGNVNSAGDLKFYGVAVTVPEPTGSVLVLSGGLLMLFRRRR